MIWWGSLAISSAWHRGIYWGWPGWKKGENTSKRKDSKKMLTEVQKFFSQVYIRDWTNLYQHKLQDGEALLQVWQIKARRWSFLYCSLYFLVGHVWFHRIHCFVHVKDNELAIKKASFLAKLEHIAETLSKNISFPPLISWAPPGSPFLAGACTQGLHQPCIDLVDRRLDSSVNN